MSNNVIQCNAIILDRFILLNTGLPNNDNLSPILPSNNRDKKIKWTNNDKFSSITQQQPEIH